MGHWAAREGSKKEQECTGLPQWGQPEQTVTTGGPWCPVTFQGPDPQSGKLWAAVRVWLKEKVLQVGRSDRSGCWKDVSLGFWEVDWMSASPLVPLLPWVQER